MKKIMVTGCAGFIGSHLTEKFLDMGHRVYGVDCLLTGSLANMQGFKDHKNFHYFHHDLVNPLPSAMPKDVDYIFHLAALGSVPRSFDSPTLSYQSNVVATRNLLEWSRGLPINRFVYISSSSVYGGVQWKSRSGDGALNCEDDVLNPKSPYAFYKKICEDLVTLYSRCFQVPVITFRLFNVFGPRQNDLSYPAVMPKMINAMLSQKPVTIFGDGHQTRSFTYVDDVTEGLSRVLYPSNRLLKWTYNLCDARSTSILDLYFNLYRVLNMEAPMQAIEFFPEREGDIRSSAGRITWLQQDFDFCPTWNDAALKATANFYRGKFEEKLKGQQDQKAAEFSL